MTKIDSRTIRQRVYEELKHSIVAGLVVPGQSISLRRLAEQFGVSLMPVREAVWQLESEGALVVESNRRIHVSKLTAEEMEEALRIRLMLETDAARRACLARPEEAVAELGRSLKQMIETAERPRRFMTMNQEFHFSLYAHAGSPMLLKLIEQIWVRVGPYFFVHAREYRHMEKTLELHHKMYEAYRRKDPDTLQRALEADLTGTAEFLLPILRREGGAVSAGGLL